jgi:hypothetical protein
MENISLILKSSIMKKQTSLVLAGILLLAICQITVAQSRYETENMKHRDLEKKYSIPSAVLSNFYKDHSSVTNVVLTQFIKSSDIYEISYLQNGKEVQAFYSSGTANEEPRLLATAYYSNWEEFPANVKAKLGKYDPSTFKQFYVVVNKDGNTYYSLKEVNNKQVLIKYGSDGIAGTSRIYAGNNVNNRSLSSIVWNEGSAAK